MNVFERQTLVWGGIGFIAFTFIANSVKADTTVQDHYKNISELPDNNPDIQWILFCNIYLLVCHMIFHPEPFLRNI